jgi:hypothetical protein
VGHEIKTSSKDEMSSHQSTNRGVLYSQKGHCAGVGKRTSSGRDAPRQGEDAAAAAAAAAVPGTCRNTNTSGSVFDSAREQQHQPTPCCM